MSEDKQDIIAEFVFKNFEKARTVLSLSHKNWAEVLGLTTREYVHVYLHNKVVPYRSVELAADYLNVNTKPLLAGYLDYAALAKHHLGDRTYISEMYTIGAASKLRTASYILDYITKKHDPILRDTILRQMQIKEAAFTNLDQPVNIHLLTHMWTLARQVGLETQDFVNMGLSSTQYFKPLASQILGDIKTPDGLWQKVIEEVPHVFERNAIYEIDFIDKYGCIVSSRGNPEIESALKLKKMGSFESCYIRTGIALSLTEYIGMPYSHVKKIACIHQGDPKCKWEVIFPAENDSKVFRIH